MLRAATDSYMESGGAVNMCTRPDGFMEIIAQDRSGRNAVDETAGYIWVKHERRKSEDAAWSMLLIHVGTPRNRKRNPLKSIKDVHLSYAQKAAAIKHRVHPLNT